MTALVDTHCHLDLNAFDDDRLDVVHRALDAGVRGMVLIGYNPERWKSTAELCGEFPFTRRAVGVHPNDATIWDAQVEAALVDEIKDTRPIAVGEIGLDFYRSAEHAEIQAVAFERQLEIAREYDLPVIIHQRAAEAEMLSAIERLAPVRGVMHCFTGGVDYAGRCVDAGLYLGVGGVLTYPGSSEVREAVAAVPSDRLVLETDAPFVAPQPWRGKRNEPAYIGSVAECLSSVLGVSTEEAIETTTENAIALFGSSLAAAVEAGMEYR